MKWQHKLGMILSLIGTLDTLYILPESFSKTGVTCGQPTKILGYYLDCGTVTTSEYSRIAGIPIVVFGLIFYLGTFIALLYLDDLNLSVKLPTGDGSKTDVISALLIVGSIGALLFSFYLVYIQLGVLERICRYCMVSAFSSTTLGLVFGGSWVNTFRNSE